MIVSRFGLHWSSGVPFLHQNGGSQNLISAGLESPFLVQVRPRKLRCPHDIDLSDHATADWLTDPLAQAMLPTPWQPGDKPKLIRGVDPQLIMVLSELCSPTEPLARPVWWQEPKNQTATYGVTDVTPMVFLVNDHDTRNILRHVQLAEAFQRKVLFVTRQPLPVYDGEWITTELTNAVSQEPLRALGAGALRRHMLEVRQEC